MFAIGDTYIFIRDPQFLNFSIEDSFSFESYLPKKFLLKSRGSLMKSLGCSENTWVLKYRRSPQKYDEKRGAGLQ